MSYPGGLPDFLPSGPNRQVPTVRVLDTFAYVLLWGHERAAAEMGLSIHTVRGYLRILYKELDVHREADAARALGWLTIPQRFGPSRRSASTPSVLARGS